MTTSTTDDDAGGVGTVRVIADVAPEHLKTELKMARMALAEAGYPESDLSLTKNGDGWTISTIDAIAMYGDEVRDRAHWKAFRLINKTDETPCFKVWQRRGVGCEKCLDFSRTFVEDCGGHND